MEIARLLAGSVLVIGAGLPLAACGSSGGSGSGPTLGKEYPAIKAAAESATSVRIAGHVVQNGQPLSLDMSFVKPRSASGSVSEGGTQFTIVVTQSQAYIKINKAFLQKAHLPASVCAKVCGKYLAAPASSASSFSGLTMTSLVQTIFAHPPKKSQAAIRLSVTQYHGQPAWTGTQGPYRIYIARSGKPYLLSLTRQGGESVTFSEWNTAKVSAPPASHIVSAGQL